MTIEELIKDYSERVRRAASEKHHTDIQKLLGEYRERVGEFPDLEERIAQELLAISQDPCREDARYWRIAAFRHLSKKYIPSICLILEYEQDCANQEAYVDLLIEISRAHDISNEQCVPSLRKALKYDFPSDPTHELQVKILEVLDIIGTDEALEIIRGYVDSPIFKLRQEARIILDMEDTDE